TRSDRGGHRGQRPAGVSTHAPRVHEERPLARLEQTLQQSFNPRSPRSRGATALLRRLLHLRNVSTHAPRVHEERPPLPVARPRLRLSPHAPRVPEERPPCRRGRGSARSFNPRSPRSRGATGAPIWSCAAVWFQPTLPAFTRSDRRRPRIHISHVRVSTHAP